MKAIIILALVALSVCSLNDDYNITREYIETLKEHATFEVYEYDDYPFKDLTFDEMKNKFGLRSWQLDYMINGVDQGLPKNFHVSEKWPDCTHEIRDIDSCKSSWAFTTTEVLSERLCIATGGYVNVNLSPQDMISCDHKGYGCEGGDTEKLLTYLLNNGTVSDECYPYTSGSGSPGVCKVVNGGMCVDGETAAVKYKPSKVYSIRTNEEMKRDIFEHGPILGVYFLNREFLLYKSGIFRSLTLNRIGAQFIKIVGWGIENNTKYWIAANTWGTKWGENGYFRIDLFEGWDEVYSFTPKIPQPSFLEN